MDQDLTGRSCHTLSCVHQLPLHVNVNVYRSPSHATRKLHGLRSHVDYRVCSRLGLTINFYSLPDPV